jgi:hypothetical protein
LDADVIVDLLVVAGLETVNFTPDLGSKLPLQCAALLIDGVKVLVCAAHIHETILNGWRRNHAPGGLKFPFDAGELRDACGAIDTSVFKICSEHRGVLANCGQRVETEEQQKLDMISYHESSTWVT